MGDQTGLAERFRQLHEGDGPLLMANAWDAGSATLFVALGFQALATTSSGHAASLGRLDYGVDRDEALAHAGELARTVGVPVSADLEDCFPQRRGGVAETVRRAREAGLAGCSIEDWSAEAGQLLEPAAATERVAEAVDAARAEGGTFVLTARAENHLRGNPDLDDTIARLLAYKEAGADVLYAPGVDGAREIRELVAAIGGPVNVLVRRDSPPVSELARLGVARVSVGGAFAFAAYGAAVRSARELLAEGTYAFTELAGEGARAAREAFG
jgi:2-methylisocitrate lyase-like PEP mutase family enzyme